MVDFQESTYGKMLIDVDLPNLINAVNRVGDQLEKFNKQIEDFSLNAITIDGQELEPFIRKIVARQMYAIDEIEGAAKRGEHD